MHQMLCTLRRKIPICRHSILIRWLIRFRIGTALKWWKRPRLTKTKSSRWTNGCNRSYRISHCTRTTPPMASPCCGHRDHLICVPVSSVFIPSHKLRIKYFFTIDFQVARVEPSTFRWSSAGTKSTVRPVIRSKFASAIKNCSSIMCWTLSSIVIRNHKRNGTHGIPIFN